MQFTAVVTDSDRALQRALEDVFPDVPRHLCVYHICQNVKQKIMSTWAHIDKKDGCAEGMAARDRCESRWGRLATIRSPESFEEEFRQLCSSLERVRFLAEDADVPSDSALEPTTDKVLVEQRKLVAYLRREWYPRRSQWADAFVRFPTFGLLASSPVEGMHARLKKYVETSSLDLMGVVDRIWAAHLNEREDLRHRVGLAITKRRLDLESIKVFQRTPDFRPNRMHPHLLDHISPGALELVAAEIGKARKAQEEGSLVPDVCTGYTRSVLGIPCSHELLQRGVDEPLQPAMFHAHWHIAQLRENINQDQPSVEPVMPQAGAPAGPNQFTDILDPIVPARSGSTSSRRGPIAVERQGQAEAMLRFQPRGNDSDNDSGNPRCNPSAQGSGSGGFSDIGGGFMMYHP
jgi:MULE transposase domain